jgi:hypothetical protein
MNKNIIKLKEMKKHSFINYFFFPIMDIKFFNYLR